MKISIKAIFFILCTTIMGCDDPYEDLNESFEEAKFYCNEYGLPGLYDGTYMEMIGGVQSTGNVQLKIRNTSCDYEIIKSSAECLAPSYWGFIFLNDMVDSDGTLRRLRISAYEFGDDVKCRLSGTCKYQGQTLSCKYLVKRKYNGSFEVKKK